MQIRFNRSSGRKRDILETRVRCGLRQFTKDIESVAVNFDDVRGTRSALDTECRMSFLTRAQGELNVLAVGRTAGSAMHHAIQKARRCLGTPAPIKRRDADSSNLGLPAFVR